MFEVIITSLSLTAYCSVVSLLSCSLLYQS